jgi:hypothetical protein
LAYHRPSTLNWQKIHESQNHFSEWKAIDKKWMAIVLSAYKEYVPATENVGDLLVRVSKDNSLILTDSWKIEVAYNLVTIQSVSENLLKLPSPSPKLSTAHYWIQLSAREMELVVKNLVYSIDNLDSSSMLQAGTNFDNVLLYFENAMKEMQIAYPEKFRLFGILRDEAIYGGTVIRQSCGSLRYQGRDVETRLCFGEYHNSVA